MGIEKKAGTAPIILLNILAGDVNLGAKGIDWIKSTIKNIPVIYVLGNHEYSKGSYPKTLNSIKALAVTTIDTSPCFCNSQLLRYRLPTTPGILTVSLHRFTKTSRS